MAVDYDDKAVTVIFGTIPCGRKRRSSYIRLTFFARGRIGAELWRRKLPQSSVGPVRRAETKTMLKAITAAPPQ
jgi:hypothetical protein